ncbi:MAG: ABC transporter permease [Bacteroidaceae bacterium]|nr:ABC transporter permease [Bacteroidaceae bacterium]
MHFTNLLKIALRAIAANKLRAFLTMLGIIIGVASVITMIAIGEGSKASIQSNISQMGSNMIYINPGADRGPGGARQEASAMQTLKIKDYELLAEEAKMVKSISPMVQSGGQFIFGNHNTPSTLYGVSVGYLDIRQLQVEEGEMFNEEDVRLSAKVCVIGRTVANELFPGGEDPVGKVVRFKSIPFRIVGVLKSKGYNTFGMDQDNLVLAPYSTVMKRILAVTHLSSINASALSEAYTDDAIEEITNILRRSHKLRPGIDEDNFTIRSQKEMMEMMNSTANVMTTLLLCVACISLIVGGIGIMNIMFVSVTERTKEIGLRMSVGARGVDILAQFLIEAVLMSITGGVIGVLLGGLITYSITTLAQWPVQIQPWSVMLSFAVCTFTGIFFGWYPAKKAANLDPIEAIRYE